MNSGILNKVRVHRRFLMRFSRAIIASILRPIIFYLIIMALSAIGLGSCLFWLAESSENSNLKSFLDAIYFTTATMTTVGYGDITPVTTAGKILAIIFMLSGTAIFVSFTAVLSSSIIDIEIQAGLKQSSKNQQPVE